MSFERAREMIRTNERRTSVGEHSLPPTTNEALQNAERIARIVYELDPDLDSKDSLLSSLKVVHDESGILLSFNNEYGIFEFTCFDNGRFKFYQYMFIKNAQSYLLEENDIELTDKEIKQRLKRKRYPYNK